MDYNKILDELGYPPEYNREKAIEAMKRAVEVSELNNYFLGLETNNYIPKTYNSTPQPAPQDLRERAKDVINKFRAKGPKHIKGFDMVGAMLRFASEVSAEKDRRIVNLCENVEYFMNEVRIRNKRIVELEAELSGIKTQRQHDMLLAKSAVDRIAELDGGIKVTGETSDGYHTFNELYEFRKVYNAALFNEWASKWHFMQKAIEKGKKAMWDATPKYDVHKSWRHHDGELCFGGGWFIVVAVLPTGQISNHYEAKDWDLFKIPEVEKAKYEFDGHTARDVINRILSL